MACFLMRPVLGEAAAHVVELPVPETALLLREGRSLRLPVAVPSMVMGSVELCLRVLPVEAVASLGTEGLGWLPPLLPLGHGEKSSFPRIGFTAQVDDVDPAHVILQSGGHVVILGHDGPFHLLPSPALSPDGLHAVLFHVLKIP